MKTIPLSILEIKKELKQIDNLKTKTLSLEYLASRLTKLSAGLWTPTYGINPHPDYDLCRAQIGEHSNISRLWYPPSERVQQLGRMNDIGEQMFYASYGANAQLGSLDEVGAKIGDYVTQIFCRKSSTIPLVPLVTLGHADEFFSYDQINDINYTVRDRQERKKNLMIRNWMNKEFCRKVPEGSEHMYIKTNAISKAYFKGFNCAGIFFPSVASTGKCINLVLPAHVADEHLTPVKARVVQIMARDEKQFLFRYVRESTSIESDGTIIWKEHTTYNTKYPQTTGQERVKIAEGKYLIKDSKLPPNAFYIESSKI
ncbi:hypothetical protein [Vibrio sp. CUB2]|uniref:hypothetical protein n=1 Tax=Vibrio sp. CUB2 TaxID=2315233 RepID=UPI00076ABE88|nr:hypothetical protein [Vibrio sp. CUB2]